MSRSTQRGGALLFAALYGVATFVPTMPEGAYSDNRVLALVNGDGHIVIGAYALTLAGLVFIAWSCALAQSLDIRDSALPRLVMVGGSAYGGFLMLAAAFFSAVPLGVAVGELPEAQDAFLARVLSDQGFHVLLVPGLLCASLAVAATSLAARRTGRMPRWCVVLGFVVAPLLWLGAAWAPQFLVPLWAIAVSFSLRREARVAQSVNDSSSVSAAV